MLLLEKGVGNSYLITLLLQAQSQTSRTLCLTQMEQALFEINICEIFSALWIKKKKKKILLDSINELFEHLLPRVLA